MTTYDKIVVLSDYKKKKKDHQRPSRLLLRITLAFFALSVFLFLLFMLDDYQKTHNLSSKPGEAFQLLSKSDEMTPHLKDKLQSFSSSIHELEYFAVIPATKQGLQQSPVFTYHRDSKERLAPVTLHNKQWTITYQLSKKQQPILWESFLYLFLLTSLLLFLFWLTLLFKRPNSIIFSQQISHIK
ncbi:hypothetical protein A374_07724 [Fictibacillus macauensis ZFHKF-1]|uniref:Uncharacterized protein n=1 Tax=Fictibacillus macauensis ZFHKF-1 TaxID=1196324 RepID=I8J1U2_9BACL|nr:hypothetical protein [Fictibacillus macauensis]EIT85706.1 hypothetical protein A374_07724 [Fictibacillus macauensis ZFHKF-1]